MLKVLPELGKLTRAALDLIFPGQCVGCGREGEILCPACRNSLTRLAPPLCPRCGLPGKDETPCPGCARGDTALDGLRAPFRFEGVVREAVHQLKYRNIRILAAPLGGLLHEYLKENPLPAGVLVPVPLHARRLRERGYNQAGLLAGELGRRMQLPVVADVLVRLRNTPPQAKTANVAARRQNTSGAFVCRSNELDGQRVLLVDDVATTGATLGSAAAALKTAGAVSVWGLALAREV